MKKGVLRRNGCGETREDVVNRLKQRLAGLRALRTMHQSVPFEERDLEYLKKLNKRIDSVRTGLRSAGELDAVWL